jgi:secondary thiamine-phosphate synthase enzyme
MKSGSCIVKTGKQMELVDITSLLSREISLAVCADGFCVLFNPHTTAGLTINEGADPAVRADIINGFRAMVPLDYPYRHLEGNSVAHIMASLMGSSLTIALQNGRFQLGTWQKIFFCEFDGPRTRKVHYHIVESP